jgi:fatty acid desaturase
MEKRDYHLPSELREPRNFVATLDVLLRLCAQVLFILTGLVVASDENWGIFLPVVLVNGAFMTFWGWAGIGHEFFHRTVFRSQKANKFFFAFCGVLTWSNPGYFAASHRRHHLRTLTVGDPEDQSDQFIRATELPQLIFFDFVGFAKRMSVLLKNSLGQFPAMEFEPLIGHEKNQLRQGARLVLGIQLTWICVVGIWLKQLELVVLTSLGPWTLRLPVTFLERLQHYKCARDSDSPFKSTRTIVLPRVIRLLYANMNYHVEHHLFPFIPNYNLRKVHRLIYRDHVEGRSLCTGLRQLFRLIRQNQLAMKINS